MLYPVIFSCKDGIFLLFSIPLIGHWLFLVVEPFLLIAFIVMFGSRDYRRT